MKDFTFGRTRHGFIRPLLVVGLLAPLSGCGPGLRNSSIGTDDRATNLTVLGDSMDPLRDHFNARKGDLRVVVLLSPTCGVCMSGARAVMESVLKANPDKPISVTFVWMIITITDGESAVYRQADRMRDPRVRHFFDPGRMTGGRFADGLIEPGQGLAWDVFLFYEAGVGWSDRPPAPTEWFHQLGNEADQKRHRSGEDLERAMLETTRRLLPRRG